MEGDAPGLQPQRPLLWNMAYGEALKLQETAKAKGNSALQGKGVPMDLVRPPPARSLASGQPRGSDGHLLELSKGYGKLQGGRIDYASLVDYEDLPLTQDSDLDLVCQLPGPTTPHAKALASMVPLNRYVHAGERRAVLGYGRWDSHNQIFRCVVLCPACRARACNRRMWWALDTHCPHFCDSCKRDHR